MDRRTEIRRLKMEYLFRSSPGSERMTSIHVISDIREKKGISLDHLLCPDPTGVLLIAGGLAREKNGSLAATLEMLCKKYAKVIFIPGDFECGDVIDENIQIVLGRIKRLERNLANLVVLNNESYEIGDSVIFGSLFWSNKGGNLAGNSSKLHVKSVSCLMRAVEDAEKRNKKLVIVTHFPPAVKGAEKSSGENKPRLSKGIQKILDRNVVIRWVYGRSGYNGRYEYYMGASDKLISNQAGIKHFRNPLILVI